MNANSCESQGAIAGLILAAGLSRRAGPANKLLIDTDGQPMIARVAARTKAAGLAPVLVVTGHEHKRVAKAVAGLGVQCIQNPDYEEGMAASIRHGVAALDDSIDGVLICLGDMPWVEVATLVSLIDTFDPKNNREICRPLYQGKSGNPVLFARIHFDALGAIKGDRGGRPVIEANPDVLSEIDVDDAGVLRDLDRVPT